MKVAANKATKVITDELTVNYSVTGRLITVIRVQEVRARECERENEEERSSDRRKSRTLRQSRIACLVVIAICLVAKLRFCPSYQGFYCTRFIYRLETAENAPMDVKIYTNLESFNPIAL